MWPMIPGFAVVLAQAAQPSTDSNSPKMVLRQRQGAELCEAAEDARNRLREVNPQIAKARASRDSQHLIQSAAHR